MKKMENRSRKSQRGVFWLIEDSLLVVKYDETSIIGLSKSGTNYNHKEIWDHVKPRGCNKSFDYYPRGRLQVSNKGKPLIYMSTYIGEENIPAIMEAFGLTERPRVHIDGSRHYRCHFDK